MKNTDKLFEKADKIIDQGQAETELEIKDEEKLLKEIKEQFTDARQGQSDERLNSDFPWDDREELFRGKYKHPDENTKSILSTGELSSIAIDGSCRVMAQLASGRFYNSDGDLAKNTAMNLYFEEYVIPNATTGGKLLRKFRMVDMFSRVLPVIPMFVEWRADEDGYTGPDPILIHPRRLYLQPGKNSIQECDWVFIDTEVSKSWLEEKKEIKIGGKSLFKNIDKVLEQYKENEGSGASQEELAPKERNKKKSGITIRHRLKKCGDWTIYVPFMDEKSQIILNEEEFYPCIPVALKVQYPYLDSSYGFNDFDRGQGVQKSIDSTVRMNMDAFGMYVKPPVMIDKKKVTIASVIMEKGARWYGERGGVEVQNLNPGALAAFTETYGMLKGNLLSMSAQQDSSVSKTIDSGMGKTPEAIRSQGAKQGARDAWDTAMMEEFIEDVFNIMAAMIDKMGMAENSFTIIGKSMQKIQDRYPAEDLSLFLNGTKAKIPGDYLKGKWTYKIDEGSTMIKKDDSTANLMQMIEIYNKYPGIAEDFMASGQKFNQGEAFARAVIDSGIQDPEKIIVKAENPQSIPGVGEQAMTVDPNQLPPQEQQLPQDITQIMPPQESMPAMASNPLSQMITR